jgi:exosortase A
MLMNDTPALAGAGLRLPAAKVAMIVAALIAPFLLYYGTAESIVSVWNSSETFAHGYVILPISLALVWHRRAVFQRIPVQACWPAVGLLALCGAGWLFARMGDVQFAMQYAFAAMLPLTAVAVLGWPLARTLAFPLAFILLAVPFGEALIGPLINITADFTVGAVRATGIPVLRNGTYFELPTGNWSVAEACSGVRYLISSFTLGCLFAYLSYRSRGRRLLFVALSIVVPILANGLRAFMIVMIGHFSGMELATGVDHIIYGWLFFGLVMFLMFWIGSYWREDQAEPAPGADEAKAVAGAAGPVAGVALAAVLACAMWPALAAYSDKANHNPNPVRLDGARLAWSPVPAWSAWQPNYMEPDAKLTGGYAAPGAQPVSLHVLYYRNQGRGKTVISSVNRLDERAVGYMQVASSKRDEQVAGRTLTLREARLKGPQGQFLVWHWLWIDGQFTASDIKGKLRQAGAKLLMRGDDGAALMVAAPFGENPDTARAALRAFLGANLAPLEASLEQARKH